jgi:hypothetical protein
MPLSNIRKYLFSTSGSLVISGLALILVAGLINTKIEKPLLELSKQETAININNEILVFMSAGNKRLLTDLLWVQTLIESDIEHYGKKDLNNWLYLRFNAISILDPYFYENYLYGGQFLAIVKDDLEGADVIYNKGLKHFPNDYRLNYNAGFLNYYEIGNAKKGLEYLIRIRNHPQAPLYINSIIHKLQLATGIDLKEIFQFVLHNYNDTQDERLRIKLHSDLYAIKAEIDLKCLNGRVKEECDTRDFSGDSYLYKSGTYYSKKSFLPYRIMKDGKTKSSRQPVNTFD